MTKKSFIRSPWTISIGTATFSMLLTILYDSIKQKPILSTLSLVFKWIWNAIITILNYNIKVWWILLGIFIFILILYLIDKFKPEKTFKPDFYDYREDRFRVWKWTWIWKWSQSHKAWIINELKAHCPTCDTPLIDYSSIHGYYFDCPRCSFIARDGQCDNPDKIERVILDNVDRQRKIKAPN